jgi:hypothetical protein
MRKSVIFAMATIGVLAAGCTQSGNPSSGASESSPSITAGAQSTDTSTDLPTSPAPPPDETGRPTTETEKLLLRRQIDLQVGGDGILLSCRPEKSKTKLFDRDPGIWVNNIFSTNEYFGNTVLCLRGFNASAPIEVVVTAGSFTSHTHLQPVDGEPKSSGTFIYEELPAETLFIDGAKIPVYTRDYGGGPIDGPAGVLISEMWQFVPPLAAREALGHEGSFTITATQGKVNASSRQPVATPTTRDSYILYKKYRGSQRLVIVGYPAGADVPIGLYRETSSAAEKATLTKKLGTVTIPSSRVADFPLTDHMRNESPGFYCVSPPVESKTDCASLVIWPDYPGRIMVGDRGPRVTAWQEILIQAKIITDRNENRDGFYGPATRDAVMSYLEREGISNPDGGDALGRHLYNHLTG